MSPEPLLTARDLRIAFGDAAEAVRGLSFGVRRGEVLALVGESGAGKSLTARALLGMVPRGATVTGSVQLHGPEPSGSAGTEPHPAEPHRTKAPVRAGTELLGARARVHAGLWGRRTALIPQDALSALSPVHPVGAQLAAAVRSVRRCSRMEARAGAVAALERVGIPDAGRAVRAYPHEFSGGMRQRAVIAMATINAPDLVVADEPTTALDPDTQRRVLDLLVERRAATGASLLLVTHDLAAVREHADRVLVLYAGRAVEAGPVAEVFARPRAPYTAGLLASLPPDEPLPGRRLPAVPGSPPALTELPAGCAFEPRCPLTDRARCRTELPEPRRLADGREVACHRWRDVPDRTSELFLEPV